MRHEGARRRKDGDDIMLGYGLGAIMLVTTAVLLIVPSVMSYWQLRDAQQELEEQAERQGVEEIPGAGVDRAIASAIAMIVAGCVLLVAGVALVTIGMIRRARATRAGREN